MGETKVFSFPDAGGFGGSNGLTARSERQAELAPIYKQLADIACKQPPTVNIPYVPAMSNLVPVSY